MKATTKRTEPTAGLETINHSQPSHGLAGWHSSIVAMFLAGVGLLATKPVVTLAGPPDYTFTAVAYIGTPAPGGGAFVNDFEPTALNNHGQLAFTAEPDQPGEEAVFLAGAGSIQQIMRFGQNAPGASTIFSTFESGILGLNEKGDMALSFTLGSTPDFGPPLIGGLYRWLHHTQSLSPVVVPGTVALGVGTFAGANSQTSLNNQGALAFAACLGAPSDPTKSGVFFADKDGSISAVAQHGTSVPGVGVLDQALGPYLNNRGDVGFNGETGPSFASEVPCLWRAATREIEPIPGPPGFNGTFLTGFNDAGDALLAANLSPFVDNVAQVVGLGALYLRTGSNLLRVAGTGDPAPGGGIYTNIIGVTITEQAALNNRGEAVFDAATDSGDEAIYLFSKATKTLSRVAGIGDVLPGIGTIVSLEQGGASVCCPPIPPSGFPLSNAINNDRGQIAFAATVLSGTAVRGVLLLATPTGAH